MNITTFLISSYHLSLLRLKTDIRRGGSDHDLGKSFRDNEFANVYIYNGAIGELKLQESEVSEVRWFDLNEVWDEIQTSRERFCVPKPSLAVLREYLKEQAI